MGNETTINYLNYFVSSSNPSFAVMLKGKWGAGKTYFIKGLIEEWENKDVIAEDSVNLNPIYISLNGISKKQEIIDSLKSKISPLLYSKGAKFTTGLIKGFLKSALKIDFDYNNDGKDDGNINLTFDPISIFKSSNEKIIGNRILIFDDVERCKIPIDELYGYINDFVEHSQCKVILISDEEKINENNTQDSKFKYSDFKEKIIGQTFEIKPNTDQAIDFFIASVKSDIKSELELNRYLIVNVFNASKKENLRVLQRAIYEFERLFQFIDTEIKSDQETYKSVVKNYLSYHLIYFLECKTGNEDISSFQRMNLLSDEKKKDYSQYEEVVATHSLIQSTKLFTPFKLIDFIVNGNYEELINEINHSSIFAKGRVEKDWEKLWYWKLLDDNDFSLLLDRVSKSFFETNDDFDITEILHISGILFTLIDSKLYKGKNKSQVVNRAKYLIQKKDLSGFKDERGFSILTWGSWQKSYASDQTDEFKSLVKYIRDILQRIKKDKSSQIVQDIFYGITNENVDELYQKTRNYNDSLDDIIERTPMLSKLDANKFSKTILNLNNKAIFSLMHFLEHRYFPEKTYSNVTIGEHQRQERDLLVKLNSNISKEIKSKKNRNKVLRKHILENLNSVIDKSISRL